MWPESIGPTDWTPDELTDVLATVAGGAGDPVPWAPGEITATPATPPVGDIPPDEPTPFAAEELTAGSGTCCCPGPPPTDWCAAPPYSVCLTTAGVYTSAAFNTPYDLEPNRSIPAPVSLVNGLIVYGAGTGPFFFGNEVESSAMGVSFILICEDVVVGEETLFVAQTHLAVGQSDRNEPLFGPLGPDIFAPGNYFTDPSGCDYLKYYRHRVVWRCPGPAPYVGPNPQPTYGPPLPTLPVTLAGEWTYTKTEVWYYLENDPFDPCFGLSNEIVVDSDAGTCTVTATASCAGGGAPPAPPPGGGDWYDDGDGDGGF